MKTIKKIAMALALVLAFSVVAPAFNVATPFTEEVQAKSSVRTENVLVGEAFYYEVWGGKIKSVSFSKKGVLSKKKNSSSKYTFKAKKAGTTVVSIKTSDGKTKKIKIVVNSPKKLSVSFESYCPTTGYAFFKVKNDTSITFSSLTFSYVLRDATGAEVKSGKLYADYMPYKSSSFEQIYVYDPSIDFSKSTFTFEPNSSYHSFGYKFTKLANKKGKDYKLTTTKDGNYIHCKLKNKKSTDFNADVMGKFYKNGELVYVSHTYMYVEGKKSKTSDMYVSNYVDYDNVEYTVHAYTKKTNK